MTFEFLTACHVTADTDMHGLLTELLAEVLEDNLSEFDQDAVAHMIRVRHERDGGEFTAENGLVSEYKLFGFALELPTDIDHAQTVIEQFTAALLDTSPIVHAVKFEDPLLQEYLALRAAEIYVLEMKLRRVLSLIYLLAYSSRSPYDLLCDERVQPITRDKPKPDQMKAAAENQFFHITFSQYVNLNQRPDFNLASLIEAMRSLDKYEAFRNELFRKPVQHEDDAGFLAGLKDRMEAIEAMRNCVAHCRHPTPGVVANYENARPLLNQMLDDYLAQCEIAQP